MRMITTQQFPTPSFDEDGLATIRAIAEPDRRNAKSGKFGIAPTASRQSKTDTRGFRWQVRTWLDANKPDQLDLGRWIHELKCKRTFAPILRNALSLYRELMIGEVDMLYNLFPDIKPPPPVPAKKIEEMQQKIDSLQDQVDLLKGILIKQSGPGAVDMGVKMSPVKAAPLPVVDDGDDLITIRKSETAGMQAGINFIKSAFALNGMTYEKH